MQKLIKKQVSEMFRENLCDTQRDRIVVVRADDLPRKLKQRGFEPDQVFLKTYKIPDPVFEDNFGKMRFIYETGELNTSIGISANYTCSNVNLVDLRSQFSLLNMIHSVIPEHSVTPIAAVSRVELANLKKIPRNGNFSMKTREVSSGYLMEYLGRMFPEEWQSRVTPKTYINAVEEFIGAIEKLNSVGLGHGNFGHQYFDLYMYAPFYVNIRVVDGRFVLFNPAIRRWRGFGKNMELNIRNDKGAIKGMKAEIMQLKRGE